MATLVFFHAHPDDEAIITGATIARATAAGHRVVLAFATRGELGELPADGLQPGETLAARRETETRTSAEILGVHGIDFLGFRDSGMAGDPTNHDPGSFWSADIDVAARRLAHTLNVEQADVLVTYDSNGGYGHPDHIRVHQVGIRAAAIARTPAVYEATINRDHFLRLVRAARAGGADDESVPDEDAIAAMGVPAARITTIVDGTPMIHVKRAAMAAHASQIAETSIFLGLPKEAFDLTWGSEWFIRRTPMTPTAGDPLATLSRALDDPVPAL